MLVDIQHVCEILYMTYVAYEQVFPYLR